MTPKTPFEFFDVTADVGFRAYGRNLEEAFENAARAVFDTITDMKRIKKQLSKRIIIESEDEKALLYDWLTELLFIHDSEDLIFSQFRVKIRKEGLDRFVLEAEASGEEFDPTIHEIRDEVKAVTFHLMKIQREHGYTVQVILDT
jgi:SHS2 domain-containing protein